MNRTVIEIPIDWNDVCEIRRSYTDGEPKIDEVLIYVRRVIKQVAEAQIPCCCGETTFGFGAQTHRYENVIHGIAGSCHEVDEHSTPIDKFCTCVDCQTNPDIVGIDIATDRLDALKDRE